MIKGRYWTVKSCFGGGPGSWHGGLGTSLGVVVVSVGDFCCCCNSCSYYGSGSGGSSSMKVVVIRTWWAKVARMIVGRVDMLGFLRDRATWDGTCEGDVM